MASKGLFGEPFQCRLEHCVPTIRCREGGKVADGPLCYGAAIGRLAQCGNELDGITFKPGAVREALALLRAIAAPDCDDVALRGLISTIRASAALSGISVAALVEGEVSDA